jgi:hypothetical protein
MFHIWPKQFKTFDSDSSDIFCNGALPIITVKASWCRIVCVSLWSHINAVLLCMHSVYMSFLISDQSFSLAHVYYGSLQYLVSPVSSQVLAMLSTKSNLWNLTSLAMNNRVLQKDAQSTSLGMDSSPTSRRRVHPQRHISYQGKNIWSSFNSLALRERRHQ